LILFIFIHQKGIGKYIQKTNIAQLKNYFRVVLFILPLKPN